jgi:hypothetical protein
MPVHASIKSLVIALLAFHVALLFPVLAFAQANLMQGEVKQTTPIVRAVGEGNQYYLGQANELLIRVNVWGKVRQPGQYFVPATTDLITLISSAGGPQDRSRLGDVKVVRGGIGAQAEVIEVNLKKYIKTGDKRLIPDLKPEDTVIVSGSTWQLVADIFQVTAGVSAIATAYALIFIRR